MVNPPNQFQDEYLYGLIWPKSVTEALVTFLLTEKATRHWVRNSNNLHAVTAALDYLNSTFHTDYTTIEVVGRVKKLRSCFNLFDHMKSTSGVDWNREMNFLFASPHQWRLWREVYPMSRAYLTASEPMYNQLKELFAPDDDDGDDNLIIVIDSDDDDFVIFDEHVVHALPATAYFPADDDIVVISSDDGDDFVNGFFDSDVDLDFSEDEIDEPVDIIDEAVSSLSNQVPPNNDALPSEDEVNSPALSVPIASESSFALRESLRSIPPFSLRDESTSYYETD